MLSYAIIGGIVGLLTVLLSFYFKNQRYKKLLQTIQQPEYSGLYHYATYTRYNKSVKFFDSYGLLYISGHYLYYKAKVDEVPLQFDLTQCTVQQEADWRKLKWFSISTPVGEKHYFNSHKMGAFVNNSDETLNGLSIIQKKIAGLQSL